MPQSARKNMVVNPLKSFSKRDFKLRPSLQQIFYFFKNILECKLLCFSHRQCFSALKVMSYFDTSFLEHFDRLNFTENFEKNFRWEVFLRQKSEKILTKKLKSSVFCLPLLKFSLNMHIFHEISQSAEMQLHL